MMQETSGGRKSTYIYIYIYIYIYMYMFKQTAVYYS
jgi:hypothetical protein